MRLGLWALCVVMLGAACVSAPAAQPVAPTASAGPLTLRLGGAQVQALPNAVAYLARDLGFYTAEGLDVQISAFTATPQVIVALRTGAIDVGYVNNEDVLNLTATKSLDLRMIDSTSARTFFMIVSRDNVQSVADLPGRSFAISTPGGQDDSLSRKVIGGLGINVDDVHFVALGDPGTRTKALLAGQVDATTTSVSTWSTIQHQPGIKILLDVDKYYAAAPLASKGDAVTAATLSSQSEALRRYVSAIIKTSRYLAQNKQAWIDAMTTERPDISADDLGLLWDQFSQSWAVNGQLNLADYQRSADLIYTTATFKDTPRIPVTDWIDTHLVDQVLHDLGVFPGFDDPGRQIN